MDEMRRHLQYRTEVMKGFKNLHFTLEELLLTIV